MRKLKLSIVLVLSLVLVLLVVQNTAFVQAHFLGFTTEMSLVVLLFLTGSLGFRSGLVLGFLSKKQGRTVYQRAAKELRQGVLNKRWL